MGLTRKRKTHKYVPPKHILTDPWKKTKCAKFSASCFELDSLETGFLLLGCSLFSITNVAVGGKGGGYLTKYHSK